MMNWKLVENLSQLDDIVVFSGGACNIRSETGERLRNQERDAINGWLTRNDILFYDPQIHPDTHNTTYTYEIHQPLEVGARKQAKVNLFEISPRTFGGSTALEVAVDEFRYKDPTIIYFSDGNHQLDAIPAHSPDGYPLFAPYGIDRDDEARMFHYHEFVRGANRMRRYLMHFAEDLSALTITFGDQSFEGDVVISPTRMHAADFFRAVVRAAQGRRTVINFIGGDATRDTDGYPVLSAPKNPRQADLESFLDQYVDEANALRRAIAELVRINVFSRVVFTQRAAIDAISDLLRVQNIKSDFVD